MQIKIKSFAFTAVLLSAVAALPVLAASQMVQDGSPPLYVEEQTKGGKMLLQLDQGEAMVKMMTCLQVRLPGFPGDGILEMAKKSALAGMRSKNGYPYFPQELLQLPCTDSDFERYFDGQKVASTQAWQKLLKIYQDAPAPVAPPKKKLLPKNKPGRNDEDAPKEPSKSEEDHTSATLSPDDFI